MESICQEIELAAKNTQNPDQNIRKQAETYLKQFQAQPNALEISKFILDNSTQSIAQFHAAITIKENLIRHRQDLQKWVHYLLMYTMEKYSKLLYHVRGALLQTIAIVAKLTWLGSKDPIKNDLMRALTDLMNNQAIEFKKLGLGLILALLNEFQFTNGTSLGLAIDFHLACQTSFQKAHLLDIFKLVLQATNQAASVGDNEEFLMFSLTCCEKILSWDFGTNSTALFGNKSEVHIGKERVALKLPLEWKTVILVPAVTQLFFQLAQTYGDEGTLSSKPISCIVQLAGVHGPIFESKQIQQAYIANFISSFKIYLNQILEHVVSPEFSPESGDKIFSLSQISKQLIRYSSLQLLASCQGILDIMQGLAQITIVCLKLKVDNLEDSWFLDAADDILLMWTSFTEKLEGLSPEEITALVNHPETGALLGLLTQISSAIVSTYIEMRVMSPSSEEDDDIEEKDLDVYGDQLLNISFLARLQVGDAIQRLIGLLTEKKKSLSDLFNSCQASNSNLMMMLQEQLHWGVLIAGHILCDSAYGETPMIPVSLLKLSQSTSPDSVVQLSSTVFSILNELEFAPGSIQHNYSSPLLIETLFWFCDRWASSYLFQTETSTPSLQLAFHGQGGKEILNFLLSKLQHQAALWYSAEDVILEIVMFIQGLSKNATARDAMVELGIFSEIVGFLLTNISRLPTSAHCPIVKAVVYVASHTTNATMRNQYCTKLCSSVEESLLSAVQRPDFQREFQAAHVKEQVVIALQQFGGLASSVDETTTIMIFNSCSKFFPTFVKLLDLYHSYSDVELFILKIFRDLVKNQSVDSLQPENHQYLYQTIHDLIQVFAKNEIGRHRPANSLDEEELFEGVSILLNLLAELIIAEYEGFERETVLSRIQRSQFKIDVPEVVFVGVNYLLPLITKDMLQYPSICLDYMHLVSLLVDYFPDRLSTLPNSLQSSLLESLLFGTQQPLSRISDHSLKAIQSLGLYNWAQSVSGKSDTNMMSSLQILLTQILQGLLTEPLDLAILENAADSVFALSMCVPNTLQNLFTSLLSGPASATMTPLINQLMKILSDQHQKQLQKLVQGQIEIGWGSAGLERYPSLNPYRKMFRVFILEGRAALLLK